MPGANPKDSLALLGIFAVVGAIFLIADIVILIRWLIYQVRLHDYRQAVAATPVYAPYPPAAGLPPVAVPAFDLPRAAEPAFDLPPPAAAEAGEAVSIAPAPLPENADGPGPANVAETEGFPASDANRIPPLPVQEVVAGVPPRPAFAPQWSLVHPFVGLQAVLGFVGLATGIPIGIWMAFQGAPRVATLDTTAMMTRGVPLFFTIVGLFLQNLFFVAVVMYFVRGYGLTLAKIGFGKPTRRQIALGLGLGALLLAIANLIEMGVGSGLQHVLPHGTFDSLKKLSDGLGAGDMFQKIPSPTAKLLFFIAGAIGAPIGEELFFRGLVYNALKHRFNVPFAIVFSGLAFALVHISPIGILVIWPMGMALAYVYERTGSLWITITMHAVNNSAAFALLWLYSGHGH